jgi:oxygen-independent coproporphyrinogen-3 oxidase
MQDPLGAYIHFPFCRSLCTYCDFFKLQERPGNERERFLDALHREIDGSAIQLPDSGVVLDTIFLGGGSPSLLTPDQIADLFSHLAATFRLHPDLEATIEVNPEVPPKWLPGYRRAGLNRISIGIQTLDDEVLAGVGRRHDSRRAIECVGAARSAGFGNVSIDLIAGLPGQDPDRWPTVLEQVVDLQPDHVSVYLLETDKETALVRQARAGLVQVPTDDAGASMYRQTRARLRQAGFRHYEISNWCRPGMASIHNLKYWTDRPYLGFGPSAHGYLHRVRYSRPAGLPSYLDHPVPVLPQPHRLNRADRRHRAEEAAIFGLRRLQGIDLDAIESRYDISLQDECGPALSAVVDAGLLRIEKRRMCLTGQGLLMANEVFQAFLSDPCPINPDPPERSA